MTPAGWSGSGPESVGLVLAGFVATALLHSTLLLGGAWLLVRVWSPKPRAEELVWRAALIAAVVSPAVAATTTFPGPLDRHRIVYAVAAAVSPRGAGAGSATPEAGRPDGRPAASPTAPVRGARTDGAAGAGTRGPGARGDRPRPPATRDSGSGARELPVRLGWWPRGPGAWFGLLGYAWAAGVALLLIRGLVGRALFAWTVRGRRAVGGRPLGALDGLRRSAGLDSRVRLTVSSEIRSPMVLSGREICVPPRLLRELDSDGRRAVLAHELGHIARRDPAWAVGVRAARLLLFFQPLALLAERRLAALAEVNSDDWAVRWSGAEALACSLAAIAEWCVTGSPTTPAPAPALAPESRDLPGRVRRLLTGGSAPAPGSGARSAVVPVVAVLLAGLAIPSLALEPSGGAGVRSGGGPGRFPAASGSGPEDRAPDPAHAVTSPSLSMEERWRRAAAVAARTERTEVTVRYGLRTPETSEDGSGRELRVRIRATVGPGGAPDGLEVEDVVVTRGRRFRGSGTEPVGSRSTLDLGVVPADSSARWLRDRVADLAREGRKPAVQRRAVEALAGHPGPVSEAYLVRLAWIHPAADVRRRAVELLSGRPSPHVFRELGIMIRRHPEPSVVRRALAAVAGYPPERAVPLLERAAEDRTGDGLGETAAELVRGLSTSRSESGGGGEGR